MEGSEKLINAAMNGHQTAGIVVAAVNQHHAHAQLADQLLIKRFHPAIAMETDQQSVELEVEAHGTNPNPVFNSPLVPFERTLEFPEDVPVLRIRGQPCGNLEQGT